MGSAHFTLLTPTFTAGVDQECPELRVPSIKGQLRWWTRAVLGNGKPEYDLFGGIKGKSNGYPNDDTVAGPFAFRLLSPKLPSAVSPLCPHDGSKGRRAALQPNANALFELHWFCLLPSRATTASANLDRVIRTWLLLGSVGCRSNRAAGSVWPAGYEPTVTEFEKEVAALALPVADLVVRVIGNAPATPDALRQTASDTLRGTQHNSLGKVLGYVERTERKASALRVKVGRFSDGYRLIVIFDFRTGRATKADYSKVIVELMNGHKQLGTDISTALSAAPL